MFFLSLIPASACSTLSLSISLRLINSKLWNRSQVIYAWQISEGCRHSSMRCLKYEQFHSFGIQEQVFMYNINLQKEERMRVKYLQFNEEWRYSVSELQKQSGNSFCQQWFFKVTLPKIRAKTHLPFLCKIGIIPDFLLQMSVQLNFLGFQSVSWCFKLPNTLRLKIKHHAKVSLMINSKYAWSLNLSTCSANSVQLSILLSLSILNFHLPLWIQNWFTVNQLFL